MEIKLAQTAGFCMGVRRAVDKVLEIALQEKGRSIYTYGPLIHSPQTIALLKSRGIIAIDSIDEIPDKTNAVLVIRAHGIAPSERKKIRSSGVRILDATCPKVGYAQSIIKKHAAQDFTVIIAGDRKHPEVDGLWGYTQGRGIIVSTIEEAEKIPCLEKVCIVAQTTQDMTDFERMVQMIKEKCPDAIVFNTICSSTEERQREIVHLAREMDVVFVVGGKNSANTCRLADLSQKQGTPTFHIESAQEINQLDLSSYSRIGVSAGASTPNWIIDEVISNIKDRQDLPKHVGVFLKPWLWAVRTDIYSAIGAACLALASMLLQNIPVSPALIAVASFFVYAMHALNRLIIHKESGMIGSFREKSYLHYKKYYRRAAIASLIAALALCMTQSIYHFLFLAVTSIAGVLYNMNILPASWRFQRLRDFPGSKNISIALAWGMVTAILPILNHDDHFHPATAIAFFFTFSLVFVRSALSDIMEMQSDKLLGHETIPVIFGKQRTIFLLKIILLILFIVLSIAPSLGLSPSLSYCLTLCVLYLWICSRLCDRRAGLSGALMEGLLETSYIITGFAVFCWFVLL